MLDTIRNSLRQSIGNVMRAYCAFLVAPGVTATLWPFAFPSSGYAQVAMAMPASVFVPLFTLAAIVAYPVAAFIGLPTYLLIRAFRQFTLPISIIVGISVTSLPWLAAGAPSALISTTALGALAGAAFWFIAEFNVIDQRHPNSNRRLLLESSILVGLAAITVGTFNAVTTREIPAEISTQVMEQFYGELLDDAEATATTADSTERLQLLENLNSRLARDETIFTVRVKAKNPVYEEFEYQREEGRNIGCTGNSNPDQRGVLRCTIGGGLIGPSAIMFNRALTSDDENRATAKIVVDLEPLMKKISQISERTPD